QRTANGERKWGGGACCLPCSLSCRSLCLRVSVALVLPICLPGSPASWRRKYVRHARWGRCRDLPLRYSVGDTKNLGGVAQGKCSVQGWPKEFSSRSSASASGSSGNCCT